MVIFIRLQDVTDGISPFIYPYIRRFISGWTLSIVLT